MAADGLLALSWNNHASTFCYMLSQIRQKDRYADATVACEGKFYPVHRIVLSTCSRYFEEMFDQTSAGKHPIVLLQDVKKYELEAILSYMYAGVVSVAQKDLSRLIKIAELLQIKGLAVPDELPPKNQSTGSSNASEKATSAQHRSHSGDSDERTSPHRKRRRREEKGVSPQAVVSSGSSTGYNKNDDDIQEIQQDAPDFLSTNKELRSSSKDVSAEDNNSSLEGRAPSSVEEPNERLHQQTSHEPPGKSGKDTNEELLWIKEEVIDDPHDVNVKSEMTYSNLKNTTDDSMDVADQDDFSQTSHGHLPLPQSESSAEALAGPSGIHEWLSGGDLGSGLSSVDAFAGEGSPPASEHPHPPQMESSEFGSHVLGSRGRGRRGDEGGDGDHHPVFQTTTTQGIKFHLCPYCSYSTPRRPHLVEHLRTHTGDKPFCCPHCPSQFSQKGTLTRHIRMHTREKPFFCTLCPEKFMKEIQLQIHLATHQAGVFGGGSSTGKF